MEAAERKSRPVVSCFPRVHCRISCRGRENLRIPWMANKINNLDGAAPVRTCEIPIR